MIVNRKGVAVESDSLTWKKSSFSNQSGCVEVAEHNGGRLVRDSKDPSGPVLVFTDHEWTAFTAAVSFGEF